MPLSPTANTGGDESSAHTWMTPTLEGARDFIAFPSRFAKTCPIALRSPRMTGSGAVSMRAPDSTTPA